MVSSFVFPKPCASCSFASYHIAIYIGLLAFPLHCLASHKLRFPGKRLYQAVIFVFLALSLVSARYCQPVGLFSMMDRIIPSPLVPETCEYVTIDGKGTLQV